MSDLAEVTQLLVQRSFEDAVGTISGGGLIDADASSDFGRASTSSAEHLGAVNRRTTVARAG